MRDREEARDLAQEIFVRVYSGLPSFRDDGAFVTWLMRMARNCCIDRLRRLKARPQTTSVNQQEELDRVDDRASAHDQLVRESRHRLLYRALNAMSDHSREMIILKEIYGLKLAEIAEMLSIPVGTVKSRSGRARVELARAIVSIDPSYGVRA
jgi:RNA polymerase sigma-70 factor (ECF subfamily)